MTDEKKAPELAPAEIWVAIDGNVPRDAHVAFSKVRIFEEEGEEMHRYILAAIAEKRIEELESVLKALIEEVDGYGGTGEALDAACQIFAGQPNTSR